MTKANRVTNEDKPKFKVSKAKIKKLKSFKTQKVFKRKQGNNLNTQPSTHLTLPKVSSVKHQVQADPMSIFFQKSNMIILSKYGSEILGNIDEAESTRLESFENFNMKIASANYDSRMLLNYFNKIITLYHLSDQTYFLTSYIIDSYINQATAPIKNAKELKLIGLTALYIASKMTDQLAFRVNEIQTHVGSNVFTADEIKDKELFIYSNIDLDLHVTTTYEIIQMVFTDFMAYSEEKINSLKIKECLNVILGNSVLLAKLIETNKAFVSIKTSLKAIGCIIVAYDIFLSNCNFNWVSNEGNEYIKLWIDLIVKKAGATKEVLQSVYNCIKDEYYNPYEYKEIRDEETEIRLECN